MIFTLAAAIFATHKNVRERYEAEHQFLSFILGKAQVWAFVVQVVGKNVLAAF